MLGVWSTNITTPTTATTTAGAAGGWAHVQTLHPLGGAAATVRALPLAMQRANPNPDPYPNPNPKPHPRTNPTPNPNPDQVRALPLAMHAGLLAVALPQSGTSAAWLFARKPDWARTLN